MIVVTGAAGFIGSHLSKRLEQDNYDIILLDDFSRGKKKYLRYLGVEHPCAEVDLRNYNNVKRWINDADTVFHVASRIGGEQFLHGSSKKELAALQDNVIIDRNVFKACIENNVRKVIYTSSISVYNTTYQGNSNAMFKEEDLGKQPLDPEGGYGWSKYLGEMQMKLMSETGIKAGVARIFKSYGPCDDYSEESGQVVCSLMRKAINYPKEDFVVWGDGSITRCLVYIDDLINALLKIEKYINKKSRTFNIGGKEPIQIKKLAENIVELSGKDIKIMYDKTKNTGPKSRIPVLDRAKQELDWQPTTSLENGLRKTYKWMEKDLKCR